MGVPRQPFDQHIQKFEVWIKSTEPPPDWADKAYAKIAAEMELMYGDDAEVHLGQHEIVRVNPGNLPMRQSANGQVDR